MSGSIPRVCLTTLLLPLLLCLVGLSVWAAEARQPEEMTAGKVADLKDTLEKGLKCRLPNEFRFVRRVVSVVEAGEFPEKDVLEIFTWARRKNERRPFVYFERAMQIKAEKLGVAL